MPIEVANIATEPLFFACNQPGDFAGQVLPVEWSG